MLRTKISSKGQITIPKKVRETLKVDLGDTIAYEIRAGGVTLRRVDPFDAAFHAAVSRTLDEWTTPEDEEAFRDL